MMVCRHGEHVKIGNECPGFIHANLSSGILIHETVHLFK